MPPGIIKLAPLDLAPLTGRIATIVQILKKFNPDQPRDVYGRWAETGGGGVTAFHGTTGRVSEIIMREGIKPQGSEGAAGRVSAMEYAGKLWLTHTLDTAKKHAENMSYLGRPIEREGKIVGIDHEELEPVIFKVRIPYDVYKKQGAVPQRRNPHELDVIFEGTIKPEWIVGPVPREELGEPVTLYGRRKAGLPDLPLGRIKKKAKKFVTLYIVVRPSSLKQRIGKLNKRLKEINKTFDPGQPRDAQGQWTETGAGGGGRGHIPSSWVQSAAGHVATKWKSHGREILATVAANALAQYQSDSDADVLKEGLMNLEIGLQISMDQARDMLVGVMKTLRSRRAKEIQKSATKDPVIARLDRLIQALEKLDLSEDKTTSPKRRVDNPKKLRGKDG